MLSLLRGEDRIIIARIVFEKSDEPYSLEGWTQITAHFKKSDGSTLEKNSDLKGGTYAGAYFGGVTFSADEIGETGNSIALVFDEIKTVAEVINSWNADNPSNRVSSDSPSGDEVLGPATIALTGGVNQYRDVIVVSEILGKIQIELNEEDTGSLKIGKNLGFKIVIDKGDNRRIVMFPSSLNVYDSSVVGY